MSTPPTLRAGDSVTWTESYPAYLPADGWRLLLRILWPSGDPWQTESEPDGDAHRITIPAADTAPWPPGRATLVRLIQRPAPPDADERVTLSACPVEILPDLAAAATLDGRSAAERALADAQAALADYLGSGRLHVQGYTINGRTMTFRAVDDLLALIDYYKREVAAERARLGLGNTRVNVRF